MHPLFKDKTGKRFGKLLVKSLAYQSKNGGYHWNCLCDCGNEKVISGSNLVSGHTKSCGCLAKKSRKERCLKHGKSKTKTFNVWNSMVQRCTNEKNPNYKNYGARNIKPCEKWLESYDFFLEDMGEKPGNLTLDRIDNSKGYFKENCRWASMKVQENNRRNNDYIKYNGKVKTLSEWAEYFNLSVKTLWCRIHILNWDTDKAFKTITSQRNVKRNINGEDLTVLEISNKYDIKIGTLRSRISRGFNNKELILPINKHRGIL